jgi:cobalt transporter subunit CbtB
VKSGDLPRNEPERKLHLKQVARRVSMANVRTSTASISVSQRITAGVICLFLGASLVFMVGLSHLSAAHNAAHDTRHSIGFPCH